MEKYEEDVWVLEHHKENKKFELNPVVFYGSSSFRLWTDLENIFHPGRSLNLGFGGSTLAACSWFFDRLFRDIEPTSIIIYAGDNDLGNGRMPEEILLFFESLLGKIRKKYKDIPVGFISVKPSPSKWHVNSEVVKTNRIIQKVIERDPTCFYIDIFNPMLKNGQLDHALYLEDGLHLSEAGYAVWEREIKKHEDKYLPLQAS